MDARTLLFVLACGAVPLIVVLLVFRFARAKGAIAVGFLLLAGSIILLSYIGMGPHGYILFVFFPFWAGCVIALAIVVTAFVRGRDAKTDKAGNP
ncbi:MAG: hypothetical protein JY451_11915 [Erythrobacter sp.]|nr:MAG: hypothetical protein JY451_11915 [Erythrobacter sp.]